MESADAPGMDAISARPEYQMSLLAKLGVSLSATQARLDASRQQLTTPGAGPAAVVELSLAARQLAAGASITGPAASGR